MKTIPFLLGLFFISSSWASSTESFIKGLQKDLLFNRTDRAVELSDSISVSPFNAVDRWMSPDAIAVYNGMLNQIKITADDLTHTRYGYELKNAQVIRGSRFNTPNLSTIFHEMGHAEMDIFVENKIQMDDIALMYHYDHELRPFYVNHFATSPHMLFQEHFAYYREDLIDFMYSEQNDIFMSNGFDRYRKTCYLTKSLKKELKDGVSLEDFKKFKAVGNIDELYRHKIGPRFIFVKGKDYDLEKAAGSSNILEKTKLLFWTYHQTFYNFPMNRKEYLKRLNERSEFRNALGECREKFWVENQKK